MWAKLHDSFVFDQHLLALGNEGFGLYARALAFSAGQLSDGFLSTAMVRTLDPGGAISRELIAAGLWDAVEGGIQIVEWSRRQRVKAQVLGEREGNRRRVQKTRNGDGNGECNAITPPVTNGVSNAHSEEEGEEEKREGESEGEREEVATQPPLARPTGTKGEPRLFGPEPEKPKRKPRPPRDYSSDPKILDALEAWNAMAGESARRIAPVTAADLVAAGWATVGNILKVRAAHPDLEDWARTGRMFASGQHEGYRTDLGLGLAARNGWLAGSVSKGAGWVPSAPPLRNGSSPIVQLPAAVEAAAMAELIRTAR